jgi:hypothetical protein
LRFQSVIDVGCDSCSWKLTPKLPGLPENYQKNPLLSHLLSGYNGNIKGLPLFGWRLLPKFLATETADLKERRFLLYLSLFLNRAATPINTSAKANNSPNVT